MFPLIGALLLDGVGVLVWFLHVFLLPALPAVSYPAFVVGFIAEVGLNLWLLVRGVDARSADSGTVRA